MSDKEPAVNKDDSNFAPGDVVAGRGLSQLVEIRRSACFGGRTMSEGVGLQSRRMVKHTEVERLQRRIDNPNARKADRHKKVELLVKLTADLADIPTGVVLAPVPVATVETEEETLSRGVPIGRNEEVEAIAMGEAMRYERSCGRTPTDLSREGEHDHIRPEGPDGRKRCIEVKESAQSGALVLKGPESDKLHQLGPKTWLRVVAFCKGERPRLRIFQHAFSKLNRDMQYRQVQFLVEESEWTPQGEEVEAPSKTEERCT